MNVIELASAGLQSPELALTAIRVSIGGFFLCSGTNKLFNKERHAAITETLKKDHVPAVGIMQWWVPGWEFTAGAMLAAGLLTSFAAGVLAIICLVACCCEARKRVDDYKPINGADRFADYLYLPEVLYLLILGVFVLDGRTLFSLDAVLF